MNRKTFKRIIRQTSTDPRFIEIVENLADGKCMNCGRRNKKGYCAVCGDCPKCCTCLPR